MFKNNDYTDAQVGDTESLFKSLKWIDGSRLKKARPKKQSLYRNPDWCCRRSLQFTKMFKNKDYTDAQVGDTESLFKSLKWIDGSRLKKARA